MTMTTIVAMLTAIAGVKVAVFGKTVDVIAEDIVLNDDYVEEDGALDDDAMDNALARIAKNATALHGTYYSGLLYEMNGFEVIIHYTGADI